MENKCICCGRPVSNHSVVYKERLFCYDCTNLFGTCAMCKNSLKCHFKTDPVNLPYTVVQNIQRGPAVIQKEVLNPERIKKTCIAKNCPCLDEDNKTCMRQFQTCKNYDEIEF